MKIRRTIQVIGLVAAIALSPAASFSQSNQKLSAKVKTAGVGNSSVKGSGTPDHITKWVGDQEIGDSEIVETDGNVGVGAAPVPSAKVLVESNLAIPGATVRASNLSNGRAIEGESSAGIGVIGRGGNVGVSGISNGGFGVIGISQTNTGVNGNSSNADGVRGVSGSTDPTFAAIRGLAGNGALAGRFTGDVTVSGMLSKGGGSFKIDHPLDPENKYLYHSFVESPDMMNIYNGNITTGESGDAAVTLPDYFEALNADFRYQLTVIGQFAQAIVAERIKGNRFVIKTSLPNVEVSWQVTGVRQDAFARKNRIKVEVNKTAAERGLYLHPEAFDQPDDRGVESMEAKRALVKQQASEPKR
jgi:hypothetical protein